MDPDNPDPHDWLGIHLWTAYDDAGARREMEHAHRLGHRTALAWLREHLPDPESSSSSDGQPRPLSRANMASRPSREARLASAENW